MERERLLIDTSILIDHFRKTRKDKTIFYRLASKYDYVISSITEFEFSVGATPKNESFIDALLSRLPVLGFDSICARKSAETYRDLKAKNQLLPVPDLFIAGTALAHGLTLLTLNRSHFERIEGLDLYQE